MTSSSPDGFTEPVPVAVWGTGNVGRAAIRAAAAHPHLELAAVLTSSASKVGIDAGELAGAEHPLGVLATDSVDDALDRVRALAYCASGDFRPDEAIEDLERTLRAGVSVATPAVYPLYDPRSAPPELRDRMEAAAAAGGAALFTSGVDPGWANDLLPVLAAGLVADPTEIRAQEIFDYSDYDAEASVRDLVGFGRPLEEVPPMVAPTVPTMVWGGQLRMMARALGVELEEITEHVERRPLEADVTTRLGRFGAGTQGALRFEVRGRVAGVDRLVIEHVTRIHPDVAPEWPQVPDGADGLHRVIVSGRPDLEISVAATEEGGSRAAGGNATAAVRLVAALPALVHREPGLYDAFDLPLTPAVNWG